MDNHNRKYKSKTQACRENWWFERRQHFQAGYHAAHETPDPSERSEDDAKSSADELVDITQINPL